MNSLRLMVVSAWKLAVGLTLVLACCPPGCS